MTLVCRNCSRINPPEAHYCWWDGSALGGHARSSGPIAVGAQPFFSPFVFPSGRQCHNFDEMVLACCGEWNEAVDLLRQGYLEGFFAALGRTDLAMAAKQAMRSADLDLGLDQLLSKLPAGTRQPAKLFVQPLEINLGQIAHGVDRRFVLRLENHGMGLLQGTIACDNTAWLGLGEGSGAPRKVFQCLHDLALTVQIHGKALRAGNKPLEGRLTIDSNGGSALVMVRADVPVLPFFDGVLAGAISPRQIAERAKAHPKEAAVFFEKGAIAQWYESNGWIYPVQGPASSGLGAIQQFFEALGLVKPPAVEISEHSLRLHGAPGAILEHTLYVRAHEKRPVFAHATTGAPWLLIGRVLLEGRTAHIPLTVEVPPRPGEELHGKVQVTANGNQRFLVDVALTIAGRTAVRVDKLPVGSAIDMDRVLPPVPVLSAADVASRNETIPDVLPATAEAAAHRDAADVRGVYPVALPSRERPGARTPSRDRPQAGDSSSGFGKHLLPLGVILLLLLSVVCHDLIEILRQPSMASDSDAGPIDPEPYIAIHFHDTGDKNMPDPTMRFGLVMLRAQDPTHPGHLKKLTFDEHGRSNNTCLRVDGKESIFGQWPGVWIEMKGRLTGGGEGGRVRDGISSSWRLPDTNIAVRQEVEIVPGEQSRRLDTCLVRYFVTNKDTVAHQVGIRFMLDTFIGANDGVPFTIPGASGLCDTCKRFDSAAEVPDFIQALENDDLSNPGTVAYLQFRISKQIESPTRVLLGGWPNQKLRDIGIENAQAQLTGWDVPFLSMQERVGVQSVRDSAVTMYWDDRPLPPGHERGVGFTYGLGNVDTRESAGHLLLTVGGRLVRQGEFTLTALVHDPRPDERLTLTLPAGFSLLEGAADQAVPPVAAGAARPDSPVTWRLRAGEDGRYELMVQSSTGTRQKLPLVIRTRGVFD